MPEPEKQIFTFTAKSGNVCLLEVKGKRYPFLAIDATWHDPPSKKDIRECNAWWLHEHPEHTSLLSREIEDADQRAAAIDSFLYGSPRN